MDTAKWFACSITMSSAISCAFKGFTKTISDKPSGICWQFSARWARGGFWGSA